MKILTLKNVSLGYDTNIVIKNINFEIKEGDYLCVIGENGAGKSTLIKGILGLIKPIKGKIILDEDIKQEEVGYLPQMSTTMKNFPASVYEVVLSGCLNSRGLNPFYSKKNKELVNKNLKKLKIDSLKHKSFGELSGGQQRRVLLARALCAMKKILVLDEPTSGLDPKAINEFYKIIEKLNIEDKITIIMVSHDMKNAIKYGKKILHLAPEEIFFGTTNKYKKNIISSYFLDGDDK